MSNPGDLILAATLPELSFTATAIPNANAALQSALPALTFTAQAVMQHCTVQPCYYALVLYGRQLQ